MECLVVGTVSSEDTSKLHDLLKGMSHQPVERISFHEMVLKDPAAPPSSLQQVRLKRSLPSLVAPPDDHRQAPAAPRETGAGGSKTWIVRHEGAPMRGKGASDLPATLREVTESVCSGRPKALELFWTMSMGMELAYGMVRDGNLYQLVHEDQDIEVVISRVKKLPDPTRPTNGRFLEQRCFFVEASCRAPVEGFREPAMAIGTFAQRLQPYVDCRKVVA